jgi:hypothetical protein
MYIAVLIATDHPDGYLSNGRGSSLGKAVIVGTFFLIVGTGHGDQEQQLIALNTIALLSLPCLVSHPYPGCLVSHRLEGMSGMSDTPSPSNYNRLRGASF